VDPLGQVTVSAWDRYDRLLSRTDALGRTTRYGYDAEGRVTRVERADGPAATAWYGPLGSPVTVVDPDGATWRYEHDERGLVTVATDPAGATTRYAYDALGHVTAVTDALRHTRRVETDAAGLPTAVTDPLGATTRYRRDAFGRVVEVVDPLDQATRLEWTVEGRLAARTLPDGGTERWAYDGEGNEVAYTDALGQVTRTEIRGFDLPTARTTPDGARTGYAYDTELRLVRVTNPVGLSWCYDYDPAGRLVRETDFNGRTVCYSYDHAGQLAGHVNGAGQSLRYRRDPLGHVVEERADDSTMTFERDPVGRILRATGPEVEVTLSRDPLGRVVAETCNGRTVESRYDLLGRRVWRRTPSGAESTWELGADDRPVALHAGDHTVLFDHDAAGRETERRVGATALTQTWDQTSRLQSQSVSTRGARASRRRTYRYRPDGYVVGIGDRRFDLDQAGRVTGVDGPDSTERYAYDPAGVLVSAQWPSSEPIGAAERDYGGTQVRRAGAIRYEYDVQGRIVLRQHKRLSARPDTWRYTWNSADRLVGVLTPDRRTWRYRYDPFGRRITKQRLGQNGDVVEQVDFAWDCPVLAEQRSSTGPVLCWDTRPGEHRPLVQRERSALRDAAQADVDERFYAIVTDLVGAPTELVGADGELAWQACSTLWGAVTGTGTVDCPLRFPGQYADPESGLHYNVLRHYDPATARYVSPDPLGLGGGPDPHAYVPNPTRWLDPLGLTPCGTELYRPPRRRH